MNKDILFELIITKQCNAGCNYCPIQFENKTMSRKTMDSLIRFMEENRLQARKFFINFFGGEPLLELEKIKYFIAKTKHLHLNYSIGTNGLLLTRQILEYLNKNKVQIFISIDYTSEKKIKKFHTLFKNRFPAQTTINVTISPNHILKYFNLFEQCLNLGIRKFIFLPVCAPHIGWEKKHLLELNYLANKLAVLQNKYAHTENEFQINKCSHQKTSYGIKEFIISPEGKISADYQSLIWLHLQINKLDKSLKEKIGRECKIGNINGINLQQLQNHSAPLQSLFEEIADNLGMLKTLKKLEEAIKPLPPFMS